MAAIFYCDRKFIDLPFANHKNYYKATGIVFDKNVIRQPQYGVQLSFYVNKSENVQFYSF